MIVGCTHRCIVNKCMNIATHWTGNVLKSRDHVLAGFCDEHRNTKCNNAFGKAGCYGTYDKQFGLLSLNEEPDEIVNKNINE